MKIKKGLLRAYSVDNLPKTSLQIIFLNRSLVAGETDQKILVGNLNSQNNIKDLLRSLTFTT